MFTHMHTHNTYYTHAYIYTVGAPTVYKMLYLDEAGSIITLILQMS